MIEKAVIRTRRASGLLAGQWSAEFIGVCGEPESAYVGKARTEELAVKDLLIQAGWKAAHASPNPLEWKASRK